MAPSNRGPTSAIQQSELQIVHVAPNPGLARLNGANQGMRSMMKVFGGVLVLGGIAAADVAAFQAEPQMDPSVPDFDTIFADVHFCVRDLDFAEMGAGCGHKYSCCAG